MFFFCLFSLLRLSFHYFRFHNKRRKVLVSHWVLHIFCWKLRIFLQFHSQESGNRGVVIMILLRVFFICLYGNCVVVFCVFNSDQVALQCMQRKSAVFTNFMLFIRLFVWVCVIVKWNRFYYRLIRCLLCKIKFELMFYDDCFFALHRFLQLSLSLSLSFSIIHYKLIATKCNNRSSLDSNIGSYIRIGSKETFKLKTNWKTTRANFGKTCV